MQKYNKVILFGASAAGNKFFHHNEDLYVVVFSDNNPDLWDSMLLGVPIINPKEINDIQFDKIIITSFWADSIHKQIINELNIPEGKIIIAPKSLIKSSPMPFQHQPTLELARKAMGAVSEYLIARGLTVYVDFGTLLGLIRDGDIIPWDDDVDFAINEEDFDRAIELMEGFLPFAPKQNDIEWNVSVVSRGGNDTSIKVTFLQPGSEYNHFKIGLAKRRHVDGNSVLVGLGGMLYSPSHHFLKHEKIEALGYTFCTPSAPEDYLTFVYGDWKTHRKNMTFQDYNHRNIPTEMDISTKYATSRKIGL